jgi:hypothetical protein
VSKHDPCQDKHRTLMAKHDTYMSKHARVCPFRLRVWARKEWK